MDLKPIRPKKDAPRDEYGIAWGRYNIWSWGTLVPWLQSKGIDTKEFSGFNDGKIISNKTCMAVAAILEKYGDELGKGWKDDAVLWRTCGGYRQY